MNIDSNNDISKLKVMLENERIEKGLCAFHFTIGMTSGASAQEIAKEILEMHEAYLAGNFVDITDQVL